MSVPASAIPVAQRSPKPESLADWLRWMERMHPRAVELGLERCRSVAIPLGVTSPPMPVVSVAGTNGKGSCVALVEAMLGAAGYRVGSYTSPHLLRYNERVRIAGREVDEAALVGAFERVDAARDGRSLTFFEFGTLAALDLFLRAPVDDMLLEVGLGGRLDAVNVVDADVAMVTGIALDHVEWLGSDREAIAREKAGIFRPHRPVVSGDPEPPQSLAREAARVGAPLYQAGVEFSWQRDADGWTWRSPTRTLAGLAPPGIPGAVQYRNAAAALMVAELLQERLASGEPAWRQGIEAATLPARFEVFHGEVERIVDVAHNPGAADVLGEHLAAHPCRGRTHLVLGMLSDKDVGGVVRALGPHVHCWYPASLEGPRGAQATAVAAAIREAGYRPRGQFADVAAARAAALGAAQAGDRVVLCGSFLTAAAALVLEGR